MALKSDFLAVGGMVCNMAQVAHARFVAAVNYPRATNRPPEPARYELTFSGHTVTTKDPAEIAAIDAWLNAG